MKPNTPALDEHDGDVPTPGPTSRERSVTPRRGERPSATAAARSGEHARAASLELLIDSVKDYAIFMLDGEGRVLTWNTGAEHLKGYARAEIVGRHFSIFYLEADVAAGKPEHALAVAKATGRYEAEGLRVRKDGSLFWANVVITAVHDEAGEHVGFAKVTRDLTEQKRAEEALRASEERFRLIVESVKDYAIFMLDREGRVASWNTGARQIKGYEATEIVGRHFSQFYPAADVAAGKPERELDIAKATGRYEEEGCRVRKDGSLFWANVVITAVHDKAGEHIGFAKVTRDLTERRRGEEERIRLAHAQEALRLRDEFISLASHELRTPLLALDLGTQRLTENQGSPGRVARELELMRGNTARLTRLVDTLLDVARVTAGKLELSVERFDLNAALRDVIDRLTEEAVRGSTAFRIRTGGPIEGRWDRRRVEQVITYLVTNALEHAGLHPVEIKAGIEGTHAVIRVIDQGPGIREADRERIFGRFERAVSTPHLGGLGLGLYMARQIAEAHGGTVAVESELGKGAAFTFRLPLPSFAADATDGSR
jgi:PAS domain S-box-containing protein